MEPGAKALKALASLKLMARWEQATEAAYRRAFRAQEAEVLAALEG
jgi:hypothetical protein